MSAQINKIALFIDGLNLYTTARSVGFEIDFKRLLREFQSRGYLLRAFYYTAVIEDQENSSIRPLIDWLDYNGYTVVTKATKEFVDQTGRRKVKGNMDIELAVDAIELAPHIDQVVLFSGDGDFCCLVKECSGAACASSSSQLTRPSRRWSLRSCVARPTSSSTSKHCKARSPAIRESVRRANLASHRNSCSAPLAPRTKLGRNSTKSETIDHGCGSIRGRAIRPFARGRLTGGNIWRSVRNVRRPSARPGKSGRR